MSLHRLVPRHVTLPAQAGNGGVRTVDVGVVIAEEVVEPPPSGDDVTVAHHGGARVLVRLRAGRGVGGVAAFHDRQTTGRVLVLLDLGGRGGRGLLGGGRGGVAFGDALVAVERGLEAGCLLFRIRRVFARLPTLTTIQPVGLLAEVGGVGDGLVHLLLRGAGGVLVRTGAVKAAGADDDHQDERQ